MSQKRQSQITLLPPVQRNRLEEIFEALDQIHSAASENCVTDFTGSTEVETLKWLQDIIYTAQETVAEIEGNLLEQDQPILRIVDKEDQFVVLHKAE